MESIIIDSKNIKSTKDEDKKLIKIIDKTNKFISIFNYETGFYIRSGVLDSKGKDTEIDPFMSSIPQLIDVGVMGHCIHGKTGLCAKSGVQCYQNGLNTKVDNMTLDNFKSIINQIKGQTYQVALGGRGDVNKHEQFEEIVRYCRENDIVPNYTTSGLDLTDEEVRITKENCGAVAVSWYDRSMEGYTVKAINMFLNVGIKTNIHYVLGNNSIDEAIERLENNSFPKGINAVIFLLHKPIGLGKSSNVLKADNPKVKKFYELIDNNKFDFKIGFDSCNVPALINLTHNLNKDSFDTCEGGRYSCYITSDMLIIPCSFDNQDLKWSVDLNKYSIEEAWNSPKFEDFRSHFKKSCGNCKDRLSCLGGCPISREIVICEREEKNLYED